MDPNFFSGWLFAQDFGVITIESYEYISAGGSIAPVIIATPHPT